MFVFVRMYILLTKARVGLQWQSMTKVITMWNGRNRSPISFAPYTLVSEMPRKTQQSQALDESTRSLRVKGQTRSASEVLLRCPWLAAPLSLLSPWRRAIVLCSALHSTVQDAALLRGVWNAESGGLPLRPWQRCLSRTRACALNLKEGKVCPHKAVSRTARRPFMTWPGRSLGPVPFLMWPTGLLSSWCVLQPQWNETGKVPWEELHKHLETGQETSK